VIKLTFVGKDVILTGGSDGVNRSSCRFIGVHRQPRRSFDGAVERQPTSRSLRLRLLRPRVLFFTDDRESYALGNYYLAYQRAFERNASVTLAHPLDPAPAPEGFDLVVLGHATIEHFARLRGSRYIPAAIRLRLWVRYRTLRALRRTRTRVVLFTKNDYKQFEVKNAFIEFVRPDLVITHTRSALDRIHGHGDRRVTWMPFGVDVEQFTAPANDSARAYDLGFRANANSEWNNGERERFYRAIARLEGTRKLSLTLSKNGENFLLGKPYADWMRSCWLLANTVSAAGTVGPRFLEAMACGTVPIAPRQAYEGLLVADRHYIPVEAGADGNFANLESAVTRFFDDPAYREQLRDGGRALVREHGVDQHVLNVLRNDGA